MYIFPNLKFFQEYPHCLLCFNRYEINHWQIKLYANTWEKENISGLLLILTELIISIQP
jgi:hypothetical protein